MINFKKFEQRLRIATPRLAESGVNNSPTRRVFFKTDSPSRRVIDSLTRRVESHQLPDSPSRRVIDSLTRWVGADSPTSRLANSLSRGVVFRLCISPRIRSQNRNGSKGSVRDLWGTNFCKNPRKSASLPCPFKKIQIWWCKNLVNTGEG
jgi:hypothetical protein